MMMTGRVALVAASMLVFAAYAAEPRLGVGMECLDRDLWDHVPALPHLKELGIKRGHIPSPSWGSARHLHFPCCFSS